MSLPRLVAQVALAHLAARVPGKLRNLDDLLGALVGGQMSAAVRNQLGHVGRHAQLDECSQRLSRPVVGDSEHRAVDDGRMRCQNLLDLGRVDVHAPAYDDVCGPVGQEQVTVLVEMADVTERVAVALPGSLRSLSGSWWYLNRPPGLVM